MPLQVNNQCYALHPSVGLMIRVIGVRGLLNIFLMSYESQMKHDCCLITPELSKVLFYTCFYSSNTGLPSDVTSASNNAISQASDVPCVDPESESVSPVKWT